MVGGGDTTDYYTQGQAELDFLRKFGMTPQEAKAKGLQLVTGDYGDNKFVSALVDPNGQIIGQQVTNKSDKMGMLGQFALGSLAMGAGIAALGLPLTPAAAASAASSGAVGGSGLTAGGGATGLTAPAGTGFGGGIGSSIGAAAPVTASTTPGLTLPGFASGIGASIPAGSAIGALGSAAGAAAPALAAGNAVKGAGGLLSGLLDSDLVKAGVIGAGALAGSQKEPGEELKQQEKLDPRMDQFLYGSGGLLPEAMNWYSQNKSGVNPTMQQGWNMQLGILTNPAVQNQLQGMLSQYGQSVPVASNPFLRGR
jgi:hypothetical protein